MIPLDTLDPAAPLDDLGWLDEAIGAARVVAIGESAHYNREFFQIRHRLLRYLVERHGFSAYAMESGFVEGWLVDGWLRGAGRLDEVMAGGMTSLMGLWAPMRAHLEWMREHNRTAGRPVGFYGIDLPGSMVSLLPGLDAVIAYLADADPGFDVDPVIRETAAAFATASAFSAPATIAAYAELPADRRDALTAGLADLMSRMAARRLDYVRRTTVDAYERARRSLAVTVSLDGLGREMARGDQHGMMLLREATIADTVEWILRREGRIVLAAHNGHVARSPVGTAGLPAVTTMGVHLADRLGGDYLVIGTTSATGQTLNTAPDFYTGRLFADLKAPPPGSLDAVLAAGHDTDRPFATDLRRLSAADAGAIRAVTTQQFGALPAELSPLDAYDIVVHVPHVTAAEPDPDAVAAAPGEVQRAFTAVR